MSTELSFSVEQNPTPASEETRRAVLAAPGFGRHFTDHMVTIEWELGKGWHDARLRPYGPFSIDPANAVLHYAQEIFEGLKAYRHEDGSVWGFRPEANAERMQRSARRLALPELPAEVFLESIRRLVEADRDWVPAYGPAEESLYLRPVMFANENFLGVRPAEHVTYCVFASPAGAYFSGGVAPVKLWISTDFARAGRGGTGAAKCGGNYASSLAGQLEGVAHGAEQAVFLDSETLTYIDELGGMNLFLVYADGRLVTPELTGSILEGVTRSSILALGEEMGLTPKERRIPVQEWKDGVASGEITEVFACGTAAVITPVGEVVWEGGSMVNGEPDVSLTIRNRMLDLQYGRAKDTRGWLTRLA